MTGLRLTFSVALVTFLKEPVAFGLVTTRFAFACRVDLSRSHFVCFLLSCSQLTFLPACFVFRSACSAMSILFTGVRVTVSDDSFFLATPFFRGAAFENGQTDSGVIPDNSDGTFLPLTPGMLECFGDVLSGELSMVGVDLSPLCVTGTSSVTCGESAMTCGNPTTADVDATRQSGKLQQQHSSDLLVAVQHLFY